MYNQIQNRFKDIEVITLFSFNTFDIPDKLDILQEYKSPKVNPENIKNLNRPNTTEDTDEVRHN